MLVLAAVEGHKRCQHLAVGRFGNCRHRRDGIGDGAGVGVVPITAGMASAARLSILSPRSSGASRAARKSSRKLSSRPPKAGTVAIRTSPATRQDADGHSCAIMPPIDWPARTTRSSPSAPSAAQSLSQSVPKSFWKAAPSAIARHVPGSTGGLDRQARRSARQSLSRRRRCHEGNKRPIGRKTARAALEKRGSGGGESP